MIGRFLALVVACVLAACASPATIKTDFDPNARFGNDRTYSWISGDDGGALVPQSIIAGIDSRLQARGWKRVPDKGEIRVSAHVTRVKGQTFNNFYSGIGHDLNWLGIGSNWPGYVTMSTDDYEKGTLLVDMFDSGTRRAIWRGSASGVLPDDPSRVEASVQAALDKLFAGFPPGASSARGR